MSPLKYNAVFPPLSKHTVTDREGETWTAQYDGVCLGPDSYDWRVSFERASEKAVAYVEPGTSLEHESFLRDLLAEAEPFGDTKHIESGTFYNLVKDTIAGRVAWRCVERPFSRYVVRFDPDEVDFKIELTDHVFPTHIDSLRQLIDQAVLEMRVWHLSP